MKYLFFSLLILCGCSSTKMINGIPNLVKVNDYLYRGGQPTQEGWDWLKAQGIKRDIKLNTWEEAPEPYIFRGNNPIWIEYEPIYFKEQIFGVNEYTIDSVLQTLKDYPKDKIFVHCEHGQDRTGLVIAEYRLKICHWPKQQAEQEMLTNGFHKSLLGLWNYWKAEK